MAEEVTTLESSCAIEDSSSVSVHNSESLTNSQSLVFDIMKTSSESPRCSTVMTDVDSVEENNMFPNLSNSQSSVCDASTGSQSNLLTNLQDASKPAEDKSTTLAVPAITNESVSLPATSTLDVDRVVHVELMDDAEVVVTLCGIDDNDESSDNNSINGRDTNGVVGVEEKNTINEGSLPRASQSEPVTDEMVIAAKRPAEDLKAADPKKKKKPGNVKDVTNQMECVNLHCESGVGLTETPVFVLTYYGLKYRKNTIQRVCDACYLQAEQHFSTLYTMIKSGEPLVGADFPAFKDDVVVMDKIEEICEETPLSAEVTNMVEDNLNILLDEVLKKCNLDFQISETTYTVNNKLEDLSLKSKVLYEEFKDIDASLSKIRKQIYDPYKPQLRHLPPVDLTESNGDFERLLPLSKCPHPRTTKEKPPRACILPPRMILPNELTDVVTLAEFSGSKRKVLPTGPVKHQTLKPGMPVYIIRSSTFGAWLKGKITEVTQNIETPYRVEFDSYRQGYTKLVSGKQLAYTTPSAWSYPVTTRVIASFFRNPQCPSEEAYYVGIIAEPQKLLNNYRYLVFFDDGYAQYVTHENILPVCKVANNVVDDIDPQCREFIRDYLQLYPERPMVRLQPGQMVRVERDGKWWSTKVIEIDASLVRMEFENATRSEWIYRGSTRLKPLYDQLVKRTRSVGATFLKKHNKPYVEYNVDHQYNDENSSLTTEVSPVLGRNVAKKSTNSSVGALQHRGETAVYPLRPGERVEYPSRGIIRRMDLSKRIRSKTYVNHLCNIICVEWTNYAQLSTRQIPPLCIPLMVGFTRLLLKNKHRRKVVYQAPCGRKLRSMSELRTYLITTSCALGADYFDFDHWVRVTDEFHLEPSMYKTHIVDISDGAENMSVSCVNEIQDAWPQVMTYSAKRLPQKGVNLNTDTDFMVCCDCTDDCSNKENCACWTLTVAGTALGPDGIDPTVGYHYRRLLEPVNTGIYECHSGCKCSKATCMNRVVQHPLSQRLQVFRTLRKGWGLRTLSDIPTGAFICVYVGRLHTEASANEGGRVYGDEYLAELDYIEVVEQFKDGYESDVDIDDSRDDEDVEQRMPWEKKDKDVDKPFMPAVEVTPGDRSVSTRNTKIVDVDDDDDDDDVNRQMCKFTASVGTAGGSGSGSGGGGKPQQRRSVREMLGDTNEDIYIMDAKYEGNIGRYLNHSCQPNVFVQNVFVDTHDIRFPWIAFFAMSHIRAGTELTWDYNYNIGSVPGKVLYCYCGMPECRGRLL